jgi:hypothetical protein
MEQARVIKWQEWLTVGLCCFLITIPTFFEIYRTLVFGTVPYDSYQTIIQYYNSDVPYSEMWSPTFYRFAYNYLSFFFSKTLPLLRFSKSDATDANLAIFQGLAVTSYLFHWLFGLLAYYFLKVSKGFSTLVAAMVSIIALQMLNFSAFFGSDPLSICYILLLLLWVSRKWVFAMGLLFSIVVNEKVGPIFFVYGLSHLFWGVSTQRRPYIWIMGCSVATMLAYLAMKKAIPLPGFEFQTDLLQYPSRFVESIRFLFTPKGLFMNGLPLAFFVGLSWIGHRYCRKSPHDFSFLILLSIPVVLLIWGMCISMQYTIGRLVMHALPMYLVAMAAILEKYSNQK